MMEPTAVWLRIDRPENNATERRLTQLGISRQNRNPLS